MVEPVPLVGGALAGTAFDMLIDFPLDKAGLLYALEMRDAEDRYIWGIGTGDVLGGVVGAIMTVAGTLSAGKAVGVKGKAMAEALRDAGLGWLIGLTTNKIAELYGYLTTIWPVTTKTTLAAPELRARAQSRLTVKTVPETRTGTKGKYSVTG